MSNLKDYPSIDIMNHLTEVRSDLVSEKTVEEFKTLVPHARHVHLPQATHMVAGDDNDAFTATVLEYLAGLPAASGNAESDVTESVSGATP